MDSEEASSGREECGSQGGTAAEYTQRTNRRRDLWAMGVGAVISGDFFGWQVTLASGFGSALVAVAVAAVLYGALAASVCEIVSVPGMGSGPSQFAERCFGPRVAFATGLAESLRCCVILSVIISGIGSYVTEITQVDAALVPVIWLVALAGLTFLNVVGGETSTAFQTGATLVSLALLVVFYVGALIAGVDLEAYALDDDSLAATTSFQGWASVMPFALWFFLGIEELPLKMKYAIKPEKNVPQSLFVAFATLVALAAATLFISASIPPGAAEMAKKPYPLLVGYTYVFGDTRVVRWCCLGLTVGLVASLHCFIFATGEVIAQMAEAGHFHRRLRSVNPRFGTPAMALCAGAAAAYVVLAALYFAAGRDLDKVGAMAIAMCILCSLLSYATQFCCFLSLRLQGGDQGQTYRSPLGVPGAAVGLFLCFVTFNTLLLLPWVLGVEYVYGLAMATAALFCGVVVQAAMQPAVDDSPGDAHSESVDDSAEDSNLDMTLSCAES